jgi:type IX secretion system PorP/SprF family membrane protein
MKLKLYIAIALLFGVKSFAQQDAQFSHYMYNTISVNPAYAGSRNVFSANVLHRTQWVGLEGAPSTQTLSLNTPIGVKNFGLGLSVVNDKIGPSSETMISTDLSYTINASAKTKLAFGVKATGSLINIDYSKLNQYNPNDGLLNQNVSNLLEPNVGVGVYYYSNKWYVGLSSPNLIETKHYDSKNEEVLSNLAVERRHHYLIGGYVFDISENMKLKPAALIKAVEGSPLQVDVSLNTLLYERLMLGAAYRWDAAVSLMMGMQITNQLMFGYSYDLETTKLKSVNNGSHELFLRFELFNKKDKVVTPRFF